jgi:hypothetical protein
MPLRNPVVLDTDVASFLWRGKLEPEHHRKLVGCTAMLTFVTIAEFWQGPTRPTGTSNRSRG